MPPPWTTLGDGTCFVQAEKLHRHSRGRTGWFGLLKLGWTHWIDWMDWMDWTAARWKVHRSPQFLPSSCLPLARVRPLLPRLPHPLKAVSLPISGARTFSPSQLTHACHPSRHRHSINYHHDHDHHQHHHQTRLGNHHLTSPRIDRNERTVLLPIATVVPKPVSPDSE